MSVTGYLALYTTLIGWQQYQNLWSIMVGTGLVFIPFIGIVLNCFLEPFGSQEPKSAAVIALRRLMIQTVGALLIIEFCCVPTVPLDPKVLHFEPLCMASPSIATPGNTGTTYDNQFSVPTGVSVPIIWYLVMAVSNGFTHAASEGIGCASINYQTLQNQLDVSQISNPTLKNETIQFYNDCYVPAYSKYMAGNLSSSQTEQIKQYQKQYGEDDMGWIGSSALLNTPGFYDSLSAEASVKGFPFDPIRDQFEGQVSNHSQWGQPNCAQWWSDPDSGLQEKLQKVLPRPFLESVMTLDQPEVLRNIGIRKLITNSFDPGMSASSDIPRGYESLNDDNGSSGLVHIMTELGMASMQMTYYPKLYLLINALPVIQALLLLAIYALLGIMIPFSSYKVHFVITGAAIIFAITFWSYLWQLVDVINNDLIGALYPSDPNQIIPSWQSLLQGDGGGLDALFVHFIIGALYIGLPMLFLILASWTGLKISGAVSSVMGSMQAPANDAGQAAGAITKEAIAKAIRVVVTRGK